MFQINNSLNTNNHNIITGLTQFSTMVNLFNGQSNPFYQYLVFTSTYNFKLGNKEFCIRFENLPLKSTSIMEVYRLFPTVETTSGFREEKINIDVQIDSVGNFFLSQKPLQPHHIGFLFFNELERLIN